MIRRRITAGNARRPGSSGKARRAAASSLLLPLLLSVAACERGHSARWYMAHGDAMQAKVKECKANPELAAKDKDCANAIEAFVTWARATGQK